jgi:hypothetical protein
MQKIVLLILFLVFSDSARSQALKFTFTDSTFLPTKPHGQLHGISGIEYIPSKDQWHWASDRGAYFVFDSIKTIRDFEKFEKSVIPKLTNYWFESIRIDPKAGGFFYAVENEFKPEWNSPDTTTYVSYYESFPPKNPKPFYIISPMALPADNKGIESITVTKNGNLWVAPEAGWAGETEVGQDTIHFVKFVKTISGYAPGGQYSYVIDRTGCPLSATEKRGGISEILAVNETELLVLERCFDEGKGRSKEIKSKLWHVKAEGQHLKKGEEPAFDFNKDLPFVPDNVEGMSWWKFADGKRQLVVVSDDNPGLKNKQRTQVILLKER